MPAAITVLLHEGVAADTLADAGARAASEGPGLPVLSVAEAVVAEAGALAARGARGSGSGSGGDARVAAAATSETALLPSTASFRIAAELPALMILTTQTCAAATGALPALADAMAAFVRAVDLPSAAALARGELPSRACVAPPVALWRAGSSGGAAPGADAPAAGASAGAAPAIAARLRTTRLAELLNAQTRALATFAWFLRAGADLGRLVRGPPREAPAPPAPAAPPEGAAAADGAAAAPPAPPSPPREVELAAAVMRLLASIPPELAGLRREVFSVLRTFLGADVRAPFGAPAAAALLDSRLLLGSPIGAAPDGVRLVA
jgi:hypothetical protein